MDVVIPTLKSLCIGAIVLYAITNGIYPAKDIPHISLLPEELQEELQNELSTALDDLDPPEKYCRNCGAFMGFMDTNFVCSSCNAFNR